MIRYSFSADTKRCSCCNKTLPNDAFARTTQRPDGLHRSCKGCYSATRKAMKAARKTLVGGTPVA